ncbi:hypothetical protein [Clostridium botulinum]|nr:hypothetical protein [Clostridium botulinum]QPW61560.1 hypothetical protein IG390_05185 [Clostridium botulinum]
MKMIQLSLFDKKNKIVKEKEKESRGWKYRQLVVICEEEQYKRRSMQI